MIDFNELKERQGWPIEKKIDHSLGVIDEFLSRTGGMAYVSFSGGKDSTVLLDLVRLFNRMCGDENATPAVFINTGNEYPDIVRFVRERIAEGYNIRIVKGKMSPRQVWEKYGFPLISKENSKRIWYMKHQPNSAMAQIARGERFPTKKHFFDVPKRWWFLADQDFDITNKCCDVLKKEPVKRYERETGRHPIIGTMASESSLRQLRYLQRGGCNSFDNQRVDSLPLSIWTEEDIWKYINMRNLKIADIYHKGATRTGCVGCGFGCQFKDDERFRVLYENYPKYYRMIMDYTNNGVKYRDAVRMVLNVSNLYLPDETLFADL